VHLNKAQQILALIEPFVKEGRILPRNEAQINANIDDFVLIFNAEKLVACAGLKDCQQDSTGEIYSLAVIADKQNTGLSAELLAGIMSKAKKANFAQVFALTKYEKHWFIKNGFRQMTVSDLPTKRQQYFDSVRNSSIFFKGVTDAN
jgi:amino-acid N-acetyltransferase